MSRGHEDSVRDIIHIPELDQVLSLIDVYAPGIMMYVSTFFYQYLSAGWDNALRLWKAHHPKGAAGQDTLNTVAT